MNHKETTENIPVGDYTKEVQNEIQDIVVGICLNRAVGRC